MTTPTGFEPLTVNARIKVSALWTAMLIVFAYVDLFSLYRPDVRAAIEAGQISGFSIDQTFLLATTFYIVIPSVMLVATLVLRPRASTASPTSRSASPMRSLSSSALSASGITTCSAAPSRWPCLAPSRTTHGPGLGSPVHRPRRSASSRHVLWVRLPGKRRRPVNCASYAT